ncbi:MAG: hypothetical protein ABI622_04600 [Chloroflexota bacterium]
MSRLSDRTARRAEALIGTDVEPTAADASVGIQPRALSVGDADATYEAAHSAWLDALRSSASGSTRALARLAVAQQAYEAASEAVELARAEALLEHQRLEAVRRRRAELNRRAEAIAGQGVAWNRVHAEQPQRRGLLSRIFGRR